MTERPTDIELADLYVCDMLPADEEAALELRMLESPELQEHVQTALAIQQSVKLDQECHETGREDMGAGHIETGGGWRNWALAASVLLSVVATLMLAKFNVESEQLRLRIAELSQPQTSVLNVPVNIMRSSGAGTADVIVQKPPAGAAIQLDIELDAQSQNQAPLGFSLLDDTDTLIISWQASPSTDGRATALIRSEQIPTGLLQLTISSADGDVLDRRLLEFR